MPDQMPIPGTNQNCWISPADLAGQVDNILTRLARVESALSRLIGADVTAINLENICPAYGTLIAPPSGNGFIQWDSVTKTWIVTDLGMSGATANLKYARVIFEASGLTNHNISAANCSTFTTENTDGLLSSVAFDGSLILAATGTYLLILESSFAQTAAGESRIKFFSAGEDENVEMDLIVPSQITVPSGTLRMGMGKSRIINFSGVGVNANYVRAKCTSNASGGVTVDGSIEIIKLA